MATSFKWAEPPGAPFASKLPMAGVRPDNWQLSSFPAPLQAERGRAGVRYMNILRSRIVALSICETNIMKTSLILLFAALSAQAQLAVTVSPPKVVAQKAVVPLAMKNGLGEKIESARAAVFLLDQQGTMVGQATRWVIGGSQDKSGLEPGATI